MNTPSRPSEDVPAAAGDEGQTQIAASANSPPPSSLTTTGPRSGAPSSAAERFGRLPAQFGRYEVQRKLGAGGMGSVYLARDTQLGRLVALKVPHFGPESGPQVLERFHREARAAALLHHPNICPVFDVGESDGVHYLTMAYIEGQTLADLAQHYRAQPPPQTAALVHTLARALEEAHRQGIIHRDLKPSNVMIDRRGAPIIMDFGLARRLHLDEDRLTQQGVAVGTPTYMPPEQVIGDVAGMGPRSDVYSLGVILYELLSGRPPFLGRGTLLLIQIIEETPPPLAELRSDIDARLDAICSRAIAREMERRFASMAEFAQALEEYLADADSRTTVSVSTAAAPTFDPGTIEQTLVLLRTWGWGMGLKKLKETLPTVRDAAERAAVQLLHDWIAGERELPTEALGQGLDLAALRSLSAWALAGRAQILLRERAYAAIPLVLDQATAHADLADAGLHATVAHTLGVALAHQGRFDAALPPLHEALTRLGKDHFAAGRVLDSLGMVYAGKGNFHVTREFYEQALRHKQRFDDDAGLALSHGQLGRLYLDWGYLDEAEEHFQADLRLAQRVFDERGEALMYNHLGQVALVRGEREAAAGRPAAARRRWAEAAGWLDGSIQRNAAHARTLPEGYTRKDRALVYLAEGNVPEAEAQVRQAEELFHSAGFPAGLAQVNLVWGLVRRAQGECDEAIRKLRAALAFFDARQDHADAARTLWEIARTQRVSCPQTPLIAQAYQEALARAEACRRAELVRAIEDELREVDPEAYFLHIYHRVRGREVREDMPSLLSGWAEEVTVMFFDLQGFTGYSRGLDPDVVMLTLNQTMADLDAVLARHAATVTTYFGDSFMTLFREARHAERAVSAALELAEALEEFNRPRAVLGLPLFQARIGINTGSAVLGNVGTYRKMDFTAVGEAVSLAGHLLNFAEPGRPCISRTTHERVKQMFMFGSDNPRIVTPTGVGPCDVWDVIGRST